MAEKVTSVWKLNHSEAKKSGGRRFSSPIAEPAPQTGGLLGFQPAPGNLAMQRLLRSGQVQAKLTINQPGDIYEQEADRIAAQVMRMPAQSSPPKIHRLCSACEEEVHRQVVGRRLHVCEARKRKYLSALGDATK